jgi:cytochrome b6-f complex iron-sulfur subunit
VESTDKPNPPSESTDAAAQTTDTGSSNSAADASTEKAPATTKAAVPGKQVAKANTPAREVPAGTPPAARVAPGAAKATSTPTATVAKGIPKAAAAKAPGSLVESTPDPPVNKTRRRIIWATVAGFLATSFLMFLRFFLPRTLTEPSTVFRIGFPSDYNLGVDTKWQQKYRIWVNRTPDRLFVIYARCTHLGCTPDWKESETKFKCPCHGSGYDSEGINFEGPAPRPMDRAHIALDAEGQIVVDTNRLYEWPKGGTNEFEDQDSFIPL